MQFASGTFQNSNRSFRLSTIDMNWEGCRSHVRVRSNTPLLIVGHVEKRKGVHLVWEHPNMLRNASEKLRVNPTRAMHTMLHKKIWSCISQCVALLIWLNIYQLSKLNVKNSLFYTTPSIVETSWNGNINSLILSQNSIVMILFSRDF